MRGPKLLYSVVLQAARVAADARHNKLALGSESGRGADGVGARRIPRHHVIKPLRGRGLEIPPQAQVQREVRGDFPGVRAIEAQVLVSSTWDMWYTP